MISPEPAHVLPALALLTGPRRGADGSSARTDAWAEVPTWAGDPGIRGFGIRRTRGGLPVLAVYIDDRGDGAARVPGSIRLPGRGCEVPIDVLPLGPGRLQDGLTTAFLRPGPGCAVSVADQSYGTFGCLVRDPVAGGATYMLTAAHVIAKCGLAEGGEAVFQPSQPRKLGTLSSWGQIRFTDTGFPNLFDAALATVNAAQVTPSIYAIGRPAGAASLVQEGMRVQKCGATTVHTHGTVIDTRFACRFDYLLPSGEVRRAGFQRQVLCTRFTEAGDSGAAVLNEDLKVVGLVIGATDEGTVFSPIGPILTRFGVAIA